MTDRFRLRRIGLAARSGVGRLPVLVVIVALGCSVAACTGSSDGTGTRNGNVDASDVVSSLGAVPIPTGSPSGQIPTATVAHPQLLAMGAPVRVRLAGGTDAVVTALGPDELTPYTGGAKAPTSTVGVITIQVRTSRGQLLLKSGDFTSRDETGALVHLGARGTSVLRTRAGQTGSIKVAGRFTSGAAQVTWRSGGHVLALWDFNVELD